MKVFAFLFLATFVIVEIKSSSEAERLEKDSKEWLNTCAAELNISKEKLEEYLAAEDPPTERAANCLAACVLEKSGIMVKGKLQKDLIEFLVKEAEKEEGMDKVPKIARECYDEASLKTDKCDVAGALTECVNNKTKDLKDARRK